MLSTSSQFHSTAQVVIGSDYVVRSPYPDIQLPTKDIYSFITENFASYGSRIGLIDGISGREYSYNEIAETVLRFSSGLQRLGFAKGDVLAIVSPNSPEYAVLYLGTL
jgi:acyl-CoA synthetase (AMP-forming)/AMP-acid ligase II